MTWKDRYRTASFRGVEFKVEAHTADRGRRLVSHEFPGRDESFTEDLGKRTSEYRIEGYLVGADYDLERDRLVTACLEPGAAELVHPYLGELEVVCADVSVSETSDELRTCRVSMLFVEAGVAKYPSAGADSVRSISGSAQRLIAAARGGFLRDFLTAGLQSFVAEAAQGLLGRLSGLLGNLPINPLAAVQLVAGFFARTRGLADNAVALVASPPAMADEIVGTIAQVRDVYVDRAPAALEIIRAAHPAPPAAAAGTTPARAQERANNAAVAALVRQVTIAEQATVAVLQAEQSAQAIAQAALNGSSAEATGAVFQTREDAIAVREALTEAIDQEMEAPETTDEVFVALLDLRAKVVNGIPAPEFRIPRVASIPMPATMPSLVVAYRVYQDAGRSLEIAARNRARHPGFLPGGQPIEVIADA